MIFSKTLDKVGKTLPGLQFLAKFLSSFFEKGVISANLKFSGN